MNVQTYLPTDDSGFQTEHENYLVKLNTYKEVIAKLRQNIYQIRSQPTSETEETIADSNVDKFEAKGELLATKQILIEKIIEEYPITDFYYLLLPDEHHNFTEVILIYA